MKSIRQSNPVAVTSRFVLCVAVATIVLALSMTASAQTSAQSVTYYQWGSEYDAFIEPDQLMITTDGSMSEIDLAVELAQQFQTSGLHGVGDSQSTFVVALNGDATSYMEALAAHPGVKRVYQVMRFREDGEAFGIAQQLIVKFNPTVTLDDQAAFEETYDLSRVDVGLALSRVYVYEALSGNVFQVVANMQTDERVEYAQIDKLSPVYLSKAPSPQDDFFSLQWHLNNTGQYGNKDGVLADIDVLDAWEYTKGEGILVGIFDDAIDLGHEDLSVNYLGTSHSTIGLDDADYYSNYSHGTQVAGLIIASENGIGVCGVAPAARFTASNGLEDATDSQKATAFTYALESDVDVHNNSWRLRPGDVPEVIVDAIEEAADSGRDGKGIVILFAAGNEKTEISAGETLQGLSSVIQVGATGYTDTFASYSNYGETQDIMGPSLGNDGVGLVTTDVSGAEGENDGGSSYDLDDADYTEHMSGTSGATPVVTGVAALILAENGDLNRHQVRELLTHTTDLVSTVDADYDGTTGFSTKYGYGRVNARKAVEAAEDGDTWPGVPTSISAGTYELEGGDGDSTGVAISWVPSGMPSEQTGGMPDTEEVKVLLVHKLPDVESPSDGIGWRPTDGISYNGGDELDSEDGDYPDSDDPALVVLYYGTPQIVGGRHQLSDIAIAEPGDDESVYFAMYAQNSQGNYSFGVIFDQEGEVIGEGPSLDSTLFPPDVPGGRTIDPELTSPTPGLGEYVSVTATSDRDYGEAPLTVEFHGGAITPNALLEEGWSFGDGVTTAEASAVHTYQAPGVYYAVFYAQDELAAQDNEVVTRWIRIEVIDPD